ncbi:PKD domain-containing protein [Flavicella sp.]|uniref:PKD domain-containing protein n=1 Tax=Flavicella sp. TaxID=2957742 RepID=UPI003018549F
MKTLKYFFSTLFILVTVLSCVDDQMGDTGFIETVVAPSDISALFDISQDNTGTVTITPNGVGIAYYDFYFGDDTPEPEKVLAGNSVVHIYTEGTYTVRIVAIGITGLEAETTQEINVSFQAPENLEVTIENDATISKKVDVTATADNAMTFDVYFGENLDDEPVEANIGEIASFTYQEAGTYSIRVVAKGGAIETTEYTVEFEVTEISQPLVSASGPPVRQTADYISIFSDAYTDLDGTNFNPDWGQSGQGSGYAAFDLEGDNMLQYINLSYQGIELAESVDISMMEYMHIDVWTTNVSEIEISLIETINSETIEAPVTKSLVANEWNSFEIPLSDYIDQGLTLQELFQLKLEGTPWAEGSVFVDNIYFYRAETSTGSSELEGTWKMASEAGSMMIYSTANPSEVWWSIDAAGVEGRACYYDDTYVFGADGSFSNILGNETWLEDWQHSSGLFGCGTPVAPHDGSNAATYTYNEDIITLTGLGAYLGLPKVNNNGSLPDVDVTSSISYICTLSDDDNTMTLYIEDGTGTWAYKLIRQDI